MWGRPDTMPQDIIPLRVSYVCTLSLHMMRHLSPIVSNNVGVRRGRGEGACVQDYRQW